MLKDFKQDADDRRAQDEASRRVRGITMVPQRDVNKAQIEVQPKKAYKTSVGDISSNNGDDEVSDEELTKVTEILNSFSPASSQAGQNQMLQRFSDQGQHYRGRKFLRTPW